ncbi:MAG: alpha-amylase family glycosyl hydrolase, partial [Bacteroidales bacterium]
MYNPVSTYRIQFHRGFTLEQLAAQKEYFALLGPGTIYASPLLKAVPGSTHGYDVINPLEINPETGNLQEFKKLTGAFQKDGIGWLQDIVPNHMAYHRGNTWLMDVLE